MSGEDHDELRAMLTGYATGALGEEDAARLEAHLETCPDCREELALERRLVGHVSALSVPEGDPDAGWARLAAQIAREEAATAPRRREGPIGRLAAMLSGWRGIALGTAVAAAAVALVVVVTGPEPGPGRYETLTSGEQADGPVLRVRLAPGAAGIEAIAEAAGLGVVSGPSDGGVYTLAPREGTDPETALAALRARDDVALATLEGAE